MSRWRLWVIEIGYYLLQSWAWVNACFGSEVPHFEERLEASFAQTIEAKLGFKLNVADDGTGFG